MKSTALVVLIWISGAGSAEVKTFPIFDVHDGGNGSAQLLVPALSVGIAYSDETSSVVSDLVISPIHLGLGCDQISVYGTVGWRVVLDESIHHGAVVGAGLEFGRHFDLGLMCGKSSGEFFKELRLAYNFGWKGNARKSP
jgi:hypothetical protein